MSLVCSCASEVCAVMGCQRAAAIRQQYAYGTPPVPSLPNKTYPLQQLTADDVRRIVREELQRASGEKEGE